MTNAVSKQAHRLRSAAIAVIVALVLALTGILWYTNDTTALGYGTEIRITKPCTWDPSTESLQATIRVHAITKYKTDIHINVNVTTHDALSGSGYTHATNLVVSPGTTTQTITATVPVPAAEHANGYTECWLTYTADRAEPWDSPT